MKLFLSLILLATFLTSAHARPQDDAVISFYQWYLHALNQDVNAEPMKSPRIHEYVTERFLRQIARQEKPAGLGGGGPGYDPFILSRDRDKGWEHNIHVKDIHPGSATPVVQVTFGGTENHSLILVLSPEGGHWKIDRVDDADKPLAGY